MSGPTSSDLAERYRDDGFVVRRGLVPAALCNYLAGCLDMMAEAGHLVPDAAVDGSWSVYGHPTFDTLLQPVGELVRGHVGAEVLPTYSFARLYTHGAELRRHTDRPACEHSVSLQLGTDGSAPWPLALEDLHGAAHELDLEPGDALCYQGTRLPHWRAPFSGQWYGQVFLHFVAAEGLHADLVWDERPGPGHPAPTERRSR